METDNLILPHSFYERDTITVARGLIGKVFIYKKSRSVFSGRIVEVEAYTAGNDEACHAHRGKTERNKIMFGPPGHAYIYFTYGMHYCMNFVTEPENIAAAVLIRALEPLEGISMMSKNRNTEILTDLCSGPAKLTQAFGIDKKLNGTPLTGMKFSVINENYSDFEIGVSKRIGINVSVDLSWRFYMKGSKYLSRKEK
ncbi:MAG: DNA-3-methyladenine glycosylase [candidate division Zixibacteria bacterium]|nr:DNA-3-methyladenine glycosylase [candidate division Zixibacteria bacterium]